MSVAQAATVPGWYAAAFHVLIRFPPGLFVERRTCGFSLVLPQLNRFFDGYQAHTGRIDGSLMPQARLRVGVAMSSFSMQGENL